MIYSLGSQLNFADKIITIHGQSHRKLSIIFSQDNETTSNLSDHGNTTKEDIVPVCKIRGDTKVIKMKVMISNIFEVSQKGERLMWTIHGLTVRS